MGSTGYSKPVPPCVLLCSLRLLRGLVRSKLQSLAASSLLDIQADAEGAEMLELHLRVWLQDREKIVRAGPTSWTSRCTRAW